MDVELSRTWRGDVPRVPVGGRALVELGREVLRLSWDLRLAAAVRAPAVEPGFTDGLWEHDVLELFLAPGGAPRRAEERYLEVEIGPRDHWLALGFAGVRRRARELGQLAPVLVQDVGDARWRGRAELPRRIVEEWAGRPPWRGLVAAGLGLPAGDAERVLLSWPSLPGDEPDFHQPAAWALLFPRPAD